MDKFVKGENEMLKMPAKERFRTRIVAASAVKRVLDFRRQLSACPATHLKIDVQVTPIGYYAAIILNYMCQLMWQNISGENLRLLNSKMLFIFGST